MTFIPKIFIPLMLLIGAMIPIWFLLANLQPVQPPLLTFIVCSFIGVYLIASIFYSRMIEVAKRRLSVMAKQKHFILMSLLALSALGLCARLFFYFAYSYTPVSDPKTFFDSAQTLATGGGLHGNFYVAFHTYLAAYNNTLGIAMRVIPDPWLATIILNSIFDLLAASSLYLLLRKMLKPSSLLPVVGFGVWMLSPLNIIFSVISIPVVVVNFFVILTILVAYLLFEELYKLRTINSVSLSVILGLTLGIGNSFRPIFIVAIIALVMVFIISALTVNKSARFFKLLSICILSIVIIFSGIQFLGRALVSDQTDLKAAKNPSGWSMYVGSDRNSLGQWRQYQNDELGALCKGSLSEKNYDECHDVLRHAAITRYGDYGILGSVDLLLRKMYHQAEQQNYFYNANQSIVGYETSRLSKVINVYAFIYIAILFTLTTIFLYGQAKRFSSKQLSEPFLLLVTLIMIGWFLSLLLVESAPRYLSILYPLFIIFSVLLFSDRYKHIKTDD